MNIMKKSIIAPGLIASSMLYANTMTAHQENNDNNNQKIESNTTDFYKWSIETENGEFTGTCLTINDINKEIGILTNNAKILKKNIIPTSLTNENLKDKVYTWNVITKNGQASGISSSLEEAQKVVNSFGNTEIIKSNIAESITVSK